MSRPLCQIQPENVTMVRVFGTGLIIACVTAVFTGRAYFRTVVIREEQPINFWCTVGSVFMLGMMCVVGSFVC